MEDLFRNAKVIEEQEGESDNESVNEESQKPSKLTGIKNWFNNNKYMLIIISVLVLALVVVSLVLYFKCSSINTLLACKDEIVEGLNKEIIKNKSMVSKLESKNDELERLNKELQKKATQTAPKNVSEMTKEQREAIKKKINKKTSEEQPKKRKDEDTENEIDELVFNGPINKNEDEELDELPINL